LIHFYKREYLLTMSLVTSFRSITSNLRCLSFSSSSLSNYPSIQQSSEPKIPKHPRSAYNLYVSEKMKLEKRKHQSIGFIKAKDLIKLASKEWKVLPEIQKRPYEQLYKQKSDEYFTAIVKLTDEQKDDLEQDKKQAKGVRKLRKLKKELSALTADKPKSMNPYKCFMVQESKKQTGKSIGEKSKSCAAKWKTMTDAKKEPYHQKSKEMSAELQRWEDKVAKEGRDVQISALKTQIAQME